MQAPYQAIAPIALASFAEPVTAVSFDLASDTLWAGTNSGYINAFHGTQGARGVCFAVGGNLAVKKIVAGDSAVRAFGAGSNGIGSWSKGGVNKWFHRWKPPTNVTAFTSTSYSSHTLAVAATVPEIALLNAATGSVVRTSPAATVITQMDFSPSLLLAGCMDGYLRAYDPRTALTPNSGPSAIRAHSNSVQGVQVSGNEVFTIGISMRQNRPIPDQLVKVFDLRQLATPATTILFNSGPSFISAIPKRPSCVAIASASGLVNIVDATKPAASSNEFYQLDTSSYITSMAVSPTGTYMAFGDADGMINLLSQADESAVVPFNGFDGKPVEWADTVPPLPDIEWDEHTPLNSIGLPYYEEPLLSAWSPRRSTNFYPPPMKIPPQILSALKFNDNVGYAPLPKELKGRRNMTLTTARRTNGRFRSGKARGQVPRIYRRVEIEYSKFGVEDFDFGFYNKTEYSGLETHILNSYTNSLVQVLHYCMPIRRIAKSHITTNCPREHCLLCELGFVVRMLEDARGTNCQASNFCRTARVLAQATNAIELVDYGREPANVDYASMIQTFNRFLVDSMSSEGNAFPQNPVLLPSLRPADAHSPAAAPVTQLMGLDAKTLVICRTCNAVREKESMTHVVDLTYPRRSPNDTSTPDFASLVRGALLRELTHKATCQSCKRFSTFTSRRTIPSRELPPLLAVNTAVHDEETLRPWLDVRRQRFLTPQVELRGDINGVDDQETALYEIRSMVVQIVGKDRKPHLVAIVKIPEAEKRTDLKSPWFVFNDFVVENITEAEALSFPAPWKVPAIVYLERVDVRESLDYSGLPDVMDPAILCKDSNIAVKRDKSRIKHELLRPDELPTPGTMVAIDAEFVSMQQEETEFRSDGTKRVIRPARLSLARVSVLRGDGPKQGVPFIDDHIHTSEVIVDYLTEFSGIKFGDLDPVHSPYTLTPLKLVYKKLRLLVDRGCIFIGHGLSKDFRIINIFVPPDQVLDTVDLYFVRARQRRLSLRFLAWFVLGEQIQTDTHDSIEDARSALNLYKAYQRMEEEGTFDRKLEELYREGKQYNFKPPVPAAPQAPSTPTNGASAAAASLFGSPMGTSLGQLTPVQLNQLVAAFSGQMLGGGYPGGQGGQVYPASPGNPGSGYRSTTPTYGGTPGSGYRTPPASGFNTAPSSTFTTPSSTFNTTPSSTFTTPSSTFTTPSFNATPSSRSGYTTPTSTFNPDAPLTGTPPPFNPQQAFYPSPDRNWRHR
uniref:PAN2-PAN3 deadenylation complex catalytic subunit PAN2 n=1 Tax=Schizophyllum commune (strain H4-8 / FGSC 9210) TaxID=578458 RepID=D8PTC9_SCHCM